MHTPIALRVPHRVQDALAHALDRTVRAAEMRQLRRQRVLRVHVLAAAALEHELDLDLVVVLPLLEVHDGRAGTEVVARVLARQRVHRVGPQLAAPGRFRNRLADLLLHHDLVGPDRRLDLEGRHAGVLADGTLAFGGLVDVLGDDGQRLSRLGAGLFARHRHLHGGAHVRRQVRGRLDDELHHAVEELRKHQDIIGSR
jgi:hypothetical protein